MTNYDVKRLALVLAVQAEIKGMEAENLNCEALNYRMAFTIDHFKQKAEELRNLAHCHDEQL